jgi:hypothetical protein
MAARVAAESQVGDDRARVAGSGEQSRVGRALDCNCRDVTHDLVSCSAMQGTSRGCEAPSRRSRRIRHRPCSRTKRPIVAPGAGTSCRGIGGVAFPQGMPLGGCFKSLSGGRRSLLLLELGQFTGSSTPRRCAYLPPTFSTPVFNLGVLFCLPTVDGDSPCCRF